MNAESQQQNSMINELKTNIRLQWMLLAILVILLISLVKTGVDNLSVKRQETQSQHALVNRLINAANKPLLSENLELARKTAQTIIDKAPTAPSASIAEANALTDINTLNSELINRGRAKLIGTDEVALGNHTYWQVRIELSGQLEPLNLIALLAHFDGSNGFQRLPTLQYRPSASNTITIVVDYLYRSNSE